MVQGDKFERDDIDLMGSLDPEKAVNFAPQGIVRDTRTLYNITL